jgi:lysylphosphatidylglycerol synthetase-like protein (DUF2156 family)
VVSTAVNLNLPAEVWKHWLSPPSPPPELRSACVYTHALQLMSVVLCFMTCSSVDNCQRFEVVFCLHLRGGEWWQREISRLLQEIESQSSYSQQIFCCSLYVLYIFFNSRTSLNNNLKIFVFVLLSNPAPKTCACIFLQKFSYMVLYSADHPPPHPPEAHPPPVIFGLHIGSNNRNTGHF